MTGENTASRPRLTSITGVRFFAAFLVFLFHVAIMKPFADQDVSEGLFTVFSKTGWVGVSFFFVLSGFILTWSARPSDTVGAFWRRRLVKVFPNHLVMYAVTMALYAAAAVTGTTAVLNLLLLQSWVPEESVYFSVNNPSWSLGCELVFYLLFPLLHRWIGRIGARRLWWCAGALIAVIIALPAVVTALLPAEPSMMMPDKSGPALGFWLVYIFPLTRVLDFVLGIVMARIALEGRWIGIGPLPLIALFTLCYAGSLYLPALYALNAATVVPLALLIPALAHLDVEDRKTWLRGRTLTLLGEISFAFYLVHWPILVYGRRLLGEERQFSLPVGAALIALCTALALALAWLLYVGVERPAMRRWAKARRRPAPARTASGGTPPTRPAAGRPVVAVPPQPGPHDDAPAPPAPARPAR
ncbi:acyltransferase family protein [Streptomyces sp. NPDC098101]|uniref:acyltransferase family protein n=1 Tax=Streptomyces sp. NPDC098101 TaxID=3366096 RepID=UPI0038086CCA